MLLTPLLTMLLTGSIQHPSCQRHAPVLSRATPPLPQPCVPEEEGERPPPPSELPDWVVVEMLRHELLLVRAKLHGLSFDHKMGEKRLRTLKDQLRQGEPEFERLKRELEEVKNAPRGLEGTFRTAAEMERHRAQLADAAIEEQLEVQTQFREHGARLQVRCLGF